jgi:thioredoxin 1
MTMHFTDENFEQEVIGVSKEKPVLVDFFALWCGPCKLQGPIIDEVAEEIGDKAIVGKLNTEEAANTAAQYEVMSIPTLLIFKDGKVVENFIGLQSKEGLIDALKKHI